MIEISGDYFTTRDKLIPVEFIHDFVSDKARTVYEVIRVHRHIPIFLEDHLHRFLKSLAGIYKEKKPDIDIPLLTNRIRQLIDMNHKSDGNIRFQFNNNDTKKFVAWYVPVKYPSESQYSDGIRVSILPAVRYKPNIKARDIQLRDEADKLIRQHQIYEAVLVNPEGYLTEGSRSNIFFVHDKTFFTPPENMVLPGITRQKVIQLAKSHGLKLKEQMIHLDDLPNFQSCFISGTSSGILPVAIINHIEYEVHNDMLHKISNLYNSLINSYMDDFKWAEG